MASRFGGVKSGSGAKMGRYGRRVTSRVLPEIFEVVPYEEIDGEELLDVDLSAAIEMKPAQKSDDMVDSEKAELERMLRLGRGHDIPLPVMTQIEPAPMPPYTMPPTYIQYDRIRDIDYDADEEDLAFIETVRAQLGERAHLLDVDIFESIIIMMDSYVVETDYFDRNAVFDSTILSKSRPPYKITDIDGRHGLYRKLRGDLASKYGVGQANDIVVTIGDAIFGHWVAKRHALGMALIPEIRPDCPSASNIPKNPPRPVLFKPVPQRKETIKELKETLPRCQSIRGLVNLVQQREQTLLEIVKLRQADYLRFMRESGLEKNVRHPTGMFLPGPRKFVELTAVDDFTGPAPAPRFEQTFGTCYKECRPLLRSTRGGQIVVYLADEGQGSAGTARLLRDARLKTVSMQ
ncbi:Enhancer of polycomb-like [Carpediemonas membranifera]|uniref:Enhancer of polycomb-like n=1 Tax=Carpediemonas membranifera TaxID=201153 RepID=A0A8J6BU89_9EUKA|nr:Enhancer of polycomb-like [Carpediemonas membranifera]|eukprot:KAG9390096.1 Enhancer of polycomb-like [Carpediemonas membranifera]